MRKNIAVETIGWVAVASLLGAYAMLTFSVIDKGFVYQLLNLVGAIGLGATAVHTKNYQSLVVQIFWGFIGIGGLYLYFRS